MNKYKTDFVLKKLENITGKKIFPKYKKSNFHFDHISYFEKNQYLFFIIPHKYSILKM